MPIHVYILLHVRNHVTAQFQFTRVEPVIHLPGLFFSSFPILVFKTLRKGGDFMEKIDNACYDQDIVVTSFWPLTRRQSSFISLYRTVWAINRNTGT